MFLPPPQMYFFCKEKQRNGHRRRTGKKKLQGIMKRFSKYENQFCLKRTLIKLDSVLKSYTENIFPNFADSLFYNICIFFIDYSHVVALPTLHNCRLFK